MSCLPVPYPCKPDDGKVIPGGHECPWPCLRGGSYDLADPTLASLCWPRMGINTPLQERWHMGPRLTPLSIRGSKSSYGYFDGQIDSFNHEYKTGTDLTERRCWHQHDAYLDESGSHVANLPHSGGYPYQSRRKREPFFLYLAHMFPSLPNYARLRNIMTCTRKCVDASSGSCLQQAVSHAWMKAIRQDHR